MEHHSRCVQVELDTSSSRHRIRPAPSLVALLDGLTASEPISHRLSRPIRVIHPMNELGGRSTLQGRACGRLPGLPSRCTFYGMMWCDAKDILVRRVELHHPGVDDGGRQALPQRAKVRSHPRTARMPALDPCHVHVLTAACSTRSCRQARASTRGTSSPLATSGRGVVRPAEARSA